VSGLLFPLSFGSRQKSEGSIFSLFVLFLTAFSPWSREGYGRFCFPGKRYFLTFFWCPLPLSFSWISFFSLFFLCKEIPSPLPTRRGGNRLIPLRAPTSFFNSFPGFCLPDTQKPPPFTTRLSLFMIKLSRFLRGTAGNVAPTVDCFFGEEEGLVFGSSSPLLGPPFLPRCSTLVSLAFWSATQYGG